MFQFRRFPTYTYLIQCTLIRYCRIGFPHSEISGSMRMCRSPKLIAACHVLRRLLMPRHSPCALISLTCYYWSSNSCSRIMQAPYQVNFRNCNCFTLRLKVPQFCFAICLSVALLSSYSLCSVFKVQNLLRTISPDGGDKRNRTADPLLAKQVLYQLSYTPVLRRSGGP